MARRHRTTPNQIETEERQIRALELRKAGVNLRQIAEELGYASPSGACEAVKAALDRARAEPAAELREIMSARLDEMLVVAYENALQGDVDSMMAVLRIEERRARLFGLDRPMPVVAMRVDSMTVGESDFARMSTDELRELIRREAGKDDDGAP